MLNKPLDTNADSSMVMNDAHLPYIYQGHITRRTKDLVYHTGPARKAQLVVPSTPLLSPQSAVIQTLRPTAHRTNACADLRAVCGCVGGRDVEAGAEAMKVGEDAKTSQVEEADI